MEQCRLFSRSFQLIDRFITNIEKPSNALINNTVNEPDNLELKPFEDDVVEFKAPSQQKQRVVNLSVSRNAQMGSQTWSTHKRMFDNPKPMKQVIKHSTTNRSQPLGLTESPPKHQRSIESPPRAQRPPSVYVKTTNHADKKRSHYQTTESVRSRIPPRPKKLPELEEEDEDDFYSGEESNLARPRGKRSDNDYYDQLDKTETSTSVSNQKLQSHRASPIKMNCLQYLGGI